MDYRYFERISEEKLNQLGDEFVRNNYADDYNVTFKQFVDTTLNGTWDQYAASKERGPVVTQLTLEEVEECLHQENDYEVIGLAERWIDLYDEVLYRTEERINILEPASALLTVDSQLNYLLEEEY